MGTNFGGVSVEEAIRGFQSMQKVALGEYPLSSLGHREPRSIIQGFRSVYSNFHWWKFVVFGEGRVCWNGILSDNGGSSYSPWLIMRIIKQSFPLLEGQSKKEYDELIDKEYRDFCQLINK